MCMAYVGEKSLDSVPWEKKFILITTESKKEGTVVTI